MYALEVSGDFCAAHSLAWDKGGKCGQLHGHNYHVVVRVEVEMIELDGRGVVMDGRVLRGLLEKVLKDYDHDFLNRYLTIPTAEYVARMISTRLTYALSRKALAVRLTWVRVEETKDIAAIYHPEYE